MLTISSASFGASAADEQAGRYTMTPVEGGFARLDRETGATSICTGKEGAWSCKPLPEAQSEMERRIEQLESENKALKTEKKLAEQTPPEANTPPGAAAPGDSVPPAPPPNVTVPTPEDVDKMFDYVESMVKKFKERIDRLEKQTKKDEVPL